MQVSPYDIYDNKIGVRLSYIVSDEDRKRAESVELLSYGAYQSRVRRMPDLRLREGKGAGNEVLINWVAMPSDWREVCKDRFGDPKERHHPLDKYFAIDGKAKVFFDNYQFEDGSFLKVRQRDQYTVNASVLGALTRLAVARTAAKKSRGGSLRGLWQSLANDVASFKEVLKRNGHVIHNLPSSDRRLKERHDAFVKFSYDSVIDGRNNNQNAQIVTPAMLKIWQDIYAGQRGYKPTYIEVAIRYNDFRTLKVDIVNNDTGELYDPFDVESFRPASESTVYSYQSAWENRVVSHSIRSGDRQAFKVNEPFHKLKQPSFAGSIISIDDRQPPFEYAPTKRMWFYNGIDLGSEAFTTWVYGESKEGIITDFYRQMVRNYTEWGVNLPYELECEMSLNSSFQDNLLENGAMFQKVRIEANNARGKRIEAYYRPLRYGFEKKEEGWIARPFAISESNQKSAVKVPMLPKEEIIEKSLKIIERWNNTLHSNQELHPGMTRWDVFLDKQHPELTPTNWAGILPHIGYPQKSSMKAGRIILQGKHRVVGFNNEVALGKKLINIMRQIEGMEVMVYWLDDNAGNVMKALVYDMQGNMICELLGDLEYNRATLEQTDEDLKNRELTSAYAVTVQGYIRTNARDINRITIIEREVEEAPKRFVMPGLKTYTPSDDPVGILPDVETEFTEDLKGVESGFNSSTASRF